MDIQRDLVKSIESCGYVLGISFRIDFKNFATDLRLPFVTDLSLPVVTLIVFFGEV